MTENNKESLQNVAGIIFGIQHFSVHDGPGIRSTVFLKGCNLNCLWCHNPESIDLNPVISFIESKCTGCGNCFKICPDVHKTVGNKHVIIREQCKACSNCVNGCYSKALELVGKKITAQEIISDLLRDKRYYDSSGGGITLSGGEPTVQYSFMHALLTLAKSKGLHCALETNGFSNYSIYEKVLPLVDLFLYDYKETDPRKHKEYTGVDNKKIIDNLRRLNHAGARIILRCTIIPGINDRDDHFKAIAGLTKELNNVEGAELLFYHDLGVSKAERMGLESQVKYEQPAAETTEKWKKLVLGYGGKLVNA